MLHRTRACAMPLDDQAGAAVLLVIHADLDAAVYSA